MNTDRTRDADIKRAYEEVFALARGKRWTMHIPAEDTDSDFVIIAGLNAVEAAEARVAELEALVEAREDELGQIRELSETRWKRWRDMIDRAEKAEDRVTTLEAECDRAAALREAVRSYIAAWADYRMASRVVELSIFGGGIEDANIDDVKMANDKFAAVDAARLALESLAIAGSSESASRGEG